MPKAKPFSEDDEKTTIESDSQWGDEPSTTVEQGEVAEHLKALGLDGPPSQRGKVITNVTGTMGGDGLDESTVDDQNNPLMVTPPVIAPARLVITGGNDTGLETDIAAGKGYTIGRGLDNDIVLTDIAVSRKHFDLRNDGGSWVIVDRGSGNGTVVNGNLEDNPFMLANGDVIEIGNTTFRFDFQTGEVRTAQPNAFEGDDDDEMSTVAGKPLNPKMLDSIDVEIETKSPAITVPPMSRTHTRPKTLPPPVPLRPRTMSQPPAYPTTHPQGTPAPLMSSTLPMPQMANRPPAVVSGPQSPTLLSAEPINLANLMPTTIPGQGVQPQTLLGHNAMAQTLMPYGNAYPQAMEIPPHSVHAQMLVVQQQHARRGDMSTSHVPPAAFNGVAVPPRYSGAMQPLSKRTKYVIVLGAVMVFATIATVAIIKGSDKQHVAHQGNGSGSAHPNVTPLPDPKVVKQVTPPPAPPKQDPPKVVVTPPPTPPKQDPPKIATVDPPKQDPPKPIVKPDPPKQDPPKPIVRQDPPKQDPPKQIVRQDPPKQDPPKPTPHTQAKTDRDQVRTPKNPPKQDPPKQDPAPKRVATTDAVERADGLYKDKKFIEAANVLATAQKSADSDEAATLKGKSQRLLLLAHAFNTGMAPATKPTEAFDALVAANTYDSQLGGHFESDITQRLTTVAPKAALSYAAAHNYDKAHTAVQKAESLGAGSDQNVKIVKQKLESEALALYSQAINDYSDNPAAAKEKLRQVMSMVDKKSPTYQKASAKLLGN